MNEKYVSVRIKWHKTAQRPLNHGLNHAPDYVDVSIENDIWLSDPSNPEKFIHQRYQRSLGSGKQLYAPLKAACQAIVDEQKERYLEHSTINRRLAKSANHFCELLITFSRGVDPEQEGTALDDCALKTAQTFAREHNVKVIAIERHNDESKNHYHALLTAMSDLTHKPITKTIGRGQTSQLQEFADKAFSPLGIHRGIKKADRLKLTSKNNPQHDGETKREYTHRLFKLANVRNKSVAELHATLEADLAAMELDAMERKQQLEKGETLQANEQARIACQDHELADMRAWVEELDAELDQLNQVKAETARSIKRKTAQLEHEKATFEQLNRKERELKQSEIRTLELELKAANAFLKPATRWLSSDIDKKALYLKKPHGQRTLDENDHVTEFQSVAKMQSDSPQQTMEDLAQPEKINSWIRMLNAKKTFHSGLKRIIAILTAPPLKRKKPKIITFETNHMDNKI